MFDFAWSEIMVIALVALIVIGPKDLPRVLRTLGKWVARARAVAREFQGSIDQMIRESELDEVRREVQKVAEVDLDHQIRSTVDPGGELEKALEPPALEGGSTTSSPVTEQKPPEAQPPSEASPVEPPAPTAAETSQSNKTPTPV